MIVKQCMVGVMAVYCYLVACEETKKGLLIDPGGDEEKILALCKQEGVTVEYIVNTHGHPDHVCANRAIKEKTGAKIVMHEEDVAFFEKPMVQLFFRQLGLPSSPPADVPVKDGDTISVGKVVLTVIHTPGHSPGGICLYGQGQLFTGDTLFVNGLGRTDFPGGSASALMNSIRKRLLTLPPETVVWPGHGYGGARSTIGREKETNPYLSGGL